MLNQLEHGVKYIPNTNPFIDCKYLMEMHTKHKPKDKITLHNFLFGTDATSLLWILIMQKILFSTRNLAVHIFFEIEHFTLGFGTLGTLFQLVSEYFTHFAVQSRFQMCNKISFSFINIKTNFDCIDDNICSKNCMIL